MLCVYKKEIPQIIHAVSPFLSVFLIVRRGKGVEPKGGSVLDIEGISRRCSLQCILLQAEVDAVDIYYIV